jgi:hypothetical protein
MEDYHPIPVNFQRMLRVGNHLANKWMPSTVVSMVVIQALVTNAIAKVLATQLVKLANNEVMEDFHMQILNGYVQLFVKAAVMAIAQDADCPLMARLVAFVMNAVHWVVG